MPSTQGNASDRGRVFFSPPRDANYAPRDQHRSYRVFQHQAGEAAAILEDISLQTGNPDGRSSPTSSTLPHGHRHRRRFDDLISIPGATVSGREEGPQRSSPSIAHSRTRRRNQLEDLAQDRSRSPIPRSPLPNPSAHVPGRHLSYFNDDEPRAGGIPQNIQQHARNRDNPNEDVDTAERPAQAKVIMRNEDIRGNWERRHAHDLARPARGEAPLPESHSNDPNTIPLGTHRGFRQLDPIDNAYTSAAYRSDPTSSEYQSLVDSQVLPNHPNDYLGTCDSTLPEPVSMTPWLSGRNRFPTIATGEIKEGRPSFSPISVYHDEDLAELDRMRVKLATLEEEKELLMYEKEEWENEREEWKNGKEEYEKLKEEWENDKWDYEDEKEQWGRERRARARTTDPKTSHREAREGEKGAQKGDQWVQEEEQRAEERGARA